MVWRIPSPRPLKLQDFPLNSVLQLQRPLCKFNLPPPFLFWTSTYPTPVSSRYIDFPRRTIRQVVCPFYPQRVVFRDSVSTVNRRDSLLVPSQYTLKVSSPTQSTLLYISAVLRSRWSWTTTRVGPGTKYLPLTPLSTYTYTFRNLLWEIRTYVYCTLLLTTNKQSTFFFCQILSDLCKNISVLYIHTHKQ